MHIENVDDLRRFLDQEDVRALDLKYCDLNGRWHHLTVPAGEGLSALFEKGVGFDGSSVAGFSTLESGDLALVPDPTTAFVDPFFQLPTLSMLCDVAEADTLEPYPRDPRGVAKKAEAYLAGTGIADASYWGPEYEFYVFDKIAVENGECAMSVRIEPGEDETRRLPAADKAGYHAMAPVDRHQDLRGWVTEQLETNGVRVRYHHHEVGKFGQNEIEVEHETLTRAADISMMVKFFVRMGAQRFSRTATFMPKPMVGQAGSGMHFHQHLFQGKTPVFHDATGYAGLSRTALQYVAGVLDHAEALSALANPGTNSYRRLVPGFEAPVNLFFSLANRSAAIRVPKYARTPEEKRIEYRPPDATCNPYLTMAAQLMAGLDGIRRELDPTSLGFGPFDEDVFRWSAERRKAIRPLPRDLDQALVALRKDHAFLLEGDVFTPDLIDAFIRYKREKELDPLLRRPHPFEMELYYDA